jgi:hypothetical protein
MASISAGSGRKKEEIKRKDSLLTLRLLGMEVAMPRGRPHTEGLVGDDV